MGDLDCIWESLSLIQNQISQKAEFLSRKSLNGTRVNSLFCLIGPTIVILYTPEIKIQHDVLWYRLNMHLERDEKNTHSLMLPNENGK